MPELPEVETVRRSLRPLVTGRSIVAVSLQSFPGVLSDLDPAAFATLVVGRQIVDVRRRGKYLLIDFDDDSGVIVHLRMTGALTVANVIDSPLRFEQLAFALDNGRSIRFTDQRKFGRISYRTAEAWNPLESKLGPEPLGPGFTNQYLTDRLRNRTAPIKALILDQRIIAGVGNIYADEALFRSRLHPLTPGGSLQPPQISSLVRSIKSVLRAGIEHRGTSFSSYRDATGEAGTNQHVLRAYGRGRKGEPCLRCGRPLITLIAGGRTSHVCLRCQPPPPVEVEAPTR